MVYLFLTDGFELVEAMAPVDILRRANIAVTTVSITGHLSIKSTSAVNVIADALYDDCDFSTAEAVILPGGAGYQNLLASKPLLKLVKEKYDSKKLVCAICAAPKVLDEAGIYIKSTIFPSMKDEISCYTDEKVVVIGNVITACAMGVSIDFALEIVKYLKGSSCSEEIAKSIVK